MMEKIIKGGLLVLLTAFFIQHVVTSGNIQQALIYDRISFIVLLLILYLGSTFFRFFSTLLMFILVGGILFHGYMYYDTYFGSKSAADKGAKDCYTDNVSWYSKLSGGCY